MKAPRPVLRKLHNNSRDVARVEVVVPPGDELDASDAVAVQLQAASGQFQDGPSPQALLDDLAEQEAEYERVESERAEGADAAARRSAGLPALVREPVEEDENPRPAKRAAKRR